MKKVLYRFLALIALIGIVLVFHNEYVRRQLELKINTQMLTLAISSHALKQYKNENGTYPPPEESRLPKELIYPKNFVEESFQQFIPYKPKYHDVLPLDDFSSSSTSYRNIVKDSRGNTIETKGLPLRYGIREGGFVLASNGPDRVMDFQFDNIDDALMVSKTYDSTNGTVSAGDIIVRFEE